MMGVSQIHSSRARPCELSLNLQPSHGQKHRAASAFLGAAKLAWGKSELTGSLLKMPFQSRGRKRSPKHMTITSVLADVTKELMAAFSRKLPYPVPSSVYLIMVALLKG